MKMTRRNVMAGALGTLAAAAARRVVPAIMERPLLYFWLGAGAEGLL